MDESIVKHLDEPAKTLKLSEAIRIGAKLRPQCEKFYSSQGRSCAFGAAAEAVWGECDAGWPERFVREFGITSFLFEQIAFRNDTGQSREQIADWLEAKGY